MRDRGYVAGVVVVIAVVFVAASLPLFVRVLVGVLAGTALVWEIRWEASSDRNRRRAWRIAAVTIGWWFSVVGALAILVALVVIPDWGKVAVLAVGGIVLFVLGLPGLLAAREAIRRR